MSVQALQGRRRYALLFLGHRSASTLPACPDPRRRNAIGLKGREAIQFARIAGEYGCDVLEIVELAPQFDISQMSIKMAANMIYHYLGSRAKTLRDQGMEP